MRLTMVLFSIRSNMLHATQYAQPPQRPTKVAGRLGLGMGPWHLRRHHLYLPNMRAQMPVPPVTCLLSSLAAGSLRVSPPASCPFSPAFVPGRSASRFGLGGLVRGRLCGVPGRSLAHSVVTTSSELTWGFRPAGAAIRPAGAAICVRCWLPASGGLACA